MYKNFNGILTCRIDFVLIALFYRFYISQNRGFYIQKRQKIFSFLEVPPDGGVQGVRWNLIWNAKQPPGAGDPNP